MSRSSFRKEIEKLEREIQKQLTSLKIQIPVDPVEFDKKILKFTDYPYQAEFREDPSPLKVLRWCRRAGKTMIMTADDLHFALLNPRSTIICTMPKYQQIKEIYFQGEAGLHRHLERMDEDMYEALIYEELTTIIRFRNKSIILAEVPEPFTVRGHGPDKISIDEMNFIRKDKDLWLSALLPMTLTKTVYINVASTPWNKDSVYWQMCFDKGFKIFSGNAHEHDPPRYLRTWREVLKPNGPLDAKQVELMREQYAGEPWRWKREMECVFVDDETAFLPSSLIIKCQNEQLEFAKFEDNLVGEFYIGWDLGRDVDPAAVSIIEKRGDVLSLVHCKSFPLKTPVVTVMAYIKSICDRWRHVRALHYDKTGTKGIDEQINKVGFPGVLGVNFSKPTKHGLAANLKEMMMAPRKTDIHLLPADARRRFELPYDKDVQAELNVEQWEQTKGSEIYTFSHPQGSHDDRFWSTALAVYAATVGKEPAGTLIRAF